MREILFKAKRTDNGEWVEGNLITNERNENQKYIGYIFDERNGVIEDFDLVEVIPTTLCQYTGLKDKNGKKIWENDILRRDGYWDIRIEFENGAFMVRNADKIQYINRVTYTFISTFDIKEYEVIGNIFDGGFNDGKKTKEN